jgi:nuclear GTP-binding protein
MSAATRKGGKTTHHRPLSRSNKIINPNRVADKNKTHLRDNSTIKRLAMYKQKAIRNKDGEFITGPLMSRTPDERIKRVQPDRRWFGNTRTVGQQELSEFRTEMNKKISDPYSVIMRNKKLPLGLLHDEFKSARMNILSTESFSATFGAKKTRKKPKLSHATDVSSLLQHVVSENDKYSEAADSNLINNQGEMKDLVSARLFEKGQSKRIWGELYKVIDSSDVIVQVLDARDPEGTRSRRIENELKRPERRHKHLILVLNKCDLIPTWATKRWVKVLSQEYPTLAFHASITNPFGKGALIQLLRQFGVLHQEKKQISVGFVGYPNVGKSSIINTLRKKNVSTNHHNFFFLDFPCNGFLWN